MMMLCNLLSQVKVSPWKQGEQGLIVNQRLLKLALEYLKDLGSAGILRKDEMKDAVVDYLALNGDELEEVWQQWERMKRVNAQNAKGR
jgi:hypothetical protein